MLLPNGIISGLDYPDPDIIRVDQTYYLVSTTMYFMPGCEILRSYDLVHWEHAAYVYTNLDSTPGQCLADDKGVYGRGMWAATLRHHEGRFYLIFVANDTHKTYLYTSETIDGPWNKREITGFHHDSSLLFDEDGRIYLVSGNKEIHLAELSATDLLDESANPVAVLSDTVIVRDPHEVWLGYEGTHFYKIGDTYYLFFIHMPQIAGRRTEACYVAKSPQGPWLPIPDMYPEVEKNDSPTAMVPGDIFSDDRRFWNSGVAQGGIVQTPDGSWFALLFQDSGAVGRIPHLVPRHFEATRLDFGDGKDPAPVSSPIFGEHGRIPADYPAFWNYTSGEKELPTTLQVQNLRPGYSYSPLVGSDDFRSNYTGGDTLLGLKPRWQINHGPDLSQVHHDSENGNFEITTGRLTKQLTLAQNTLTMRTQAPACVAEVTVDASSVKEGDICGLAILQSSCGYVGITKRDGRLYLIQAGVDGVTADISPLKGDATIETEHTLLAVSDVFASGNAASADEPYIFRLRIEADFTTPDERRDVARFYFKQNQAFEQIGQPQKLFFKLDHFTGARFALFAFATKEAGGTASFLDFQYL